MTFSEEMDRIVRESKAFENDFFANCHDERRELHINDVVTLSLNWYLVTKHFGLSAPEYTALLARRLKYSNGEETLRRLLVASAKISSDDLGLGNEEVYAEHGGADIPIWDRLHYQLWGDITKTLIRTAQGLNFPVEYYPFIANEKKEEIDRARREGTTNQLFREWNPDQITGLNTLNARAVVFVSPATSDLVKRIEDEFTSLEGGVAVYQTVESIAYNIVIAYSNLMERVEKAYHPVFHQLFTDRDWLYLRIHQPLEKDHDRQSTSMVNLADQYLGGGYRPVIETKVRELSRLFGHFWTSMDELVFKSSGSSP